MSKKNNNMMLRIDDETYYLLQQLALATGRTKSDLLRSGIYAMAEKQYADQYGTMLVQAKSFANCIN